MILSRHGIAAPKECARLRGSVATARDRYFAAGGREESSSANLQGGLRGGRRAGVIPTTMPNWIAPRTREFLERFPDVELQFVEETASPSAEPLPSGDSIL